jgi:hypothetical protein
VTSFEELVAEGAAAPVEGWDFSWFEGRATEERPPWGYARLMGERMARAGAALDIETGGGEVLATVARPPALLVATEGWWPNVEVAPSRLQPLGRHQERGRAGHRGEHFAPTRLDVECGAGCPSATPRSTSP